MILKYWCKFVLVILVLSFACCSFVNGMEGIAIELAKFSLKFYIRALKELDFTND